MHVWYHKYYTIMYYCRYCLKSVLTTILNNNNPRLQTSAKADCSQNLSTKTQHDRLQNLFCGDKLDLHSVIMIAYIEVNWIHKKQTIFFLKTPLSNTSVHFDVLVNAQSPFCTGWICTQRTVILRLLQHLREGEVGKCFCLLLLCMILQWRKTSVFPHTVCQGGQGVTSTSRETQAEHRVEVEGRQEGWTHMWSLITLQILCKIFFGVKQNVSMIIM